MQQIIHRDEESKGTWAVLEVSLPSWGGGGAREEHSEETELAQGKERPLP